MDTLESNQLQSSLIEYQQLREEVRKLQDNQLKLYSLLITTITAILGATFTTKVFEILLLLPVISTGFTFRYLWHNNILLMLGCYLEGMDKNIFLPLLGVTGEGDKKYCWIGWQSYFINNYKMLPFHKFANQLMFIIVPFVPAIIYCAVPIVANLEDNIGVFYGTFSTKIYLFCFILFIPGSLYLSYQLWKAE